MSQKNETLPLLIALLITLGLVGAGAWFFLKKTNVNLPVSTTNSANPSQPSGGSGSMDSNIFAMPSNVPTGTTVRISGSTSMVQINQSLKNTFQQQFPGTTVDTKATGTEEGIQAVLAGQADIAAISRPLTDTEKSQGLKSIGVAQDAIAIVVGDKNPFRTGLTSQQVIDIFQGRITDWSAIGSSSAPIKVINRPAISGTHQAFIKIILKNQPFGTGPNFRIMEKDATTPILQALGKDGISYATAAQVEKQTTVRVVPVDGLTPEASNYPYVRILGYAYKDPANPGVMAFLGFAGAPLGQTAIHQANQ
jgi:phosphate transport system substrate-binding protein